MTLQNCKISQLYCKKVNATVFMLVFYCHYMGLAQAGWLLGILILQHIYEHLVFFITCTLEALAKASKPDVITGAKGDCVIFNH